MMHGNGTEWFSNWFDSPFYHLLYKNRDNREAGIFLDHLLLKINLHSGSKIADVACGRGRHAIYLNKKGFDVTGLDISVHNIEYAKKMENETLHFRIHDMRKPFATSYFDCCLNLFTSFGYFKTEEENLMAIQVMHQALKKNGIVVIDFMNTQWAVRKADSQETKNIDGIDFHIKKKVEDKVLIKEVSFKSGGTNYYYNEEVQLLRLEDFENYFSKAGFRISNVSGDYAFGKFDPEKSERLIVSGIKD